MTTGMQLSTGCYLDGDRVVRPEHDDWDKDKAIAAGAFGERPDETEEAPESGATVHDITRTPTPADLSLEEAEGEVVDHLLNMGESFAQLIKRQRAKNPVSRKRIMAIEKQATKAAHVIFDLFTDDGETAEKISKELRMKADKASQGKKAK